MTFKKEFKKPTLEHPLWDKKTSRGDDMMSGPIKFTNFVFYDKDKGEILLNGEIAMVYFSTQSQGKQPNWRGIESTPRHPEARVPEPHPQMTTLKKPDIQEPDFGESDLPF